MSRNLANFDKWFKSELVATQELTDVIGSRVYNSIAKTGTFPFGVFHYAPLKDNFGQGGYSIQDVGLCDFWIAINLRTISDQLLGNVEAAMDALDEKFKNSKAVERSGTSISIRRERPINFTSDGNSPEEKILHRGSTYKVWLAKKH